MRAEIKIVNTGNASAEAVVFCVTHSSIGAFHGNSQWLIRRNATDRYESVGAIHPQEEIGLGYFYRDIPLDRLRRNLEDVSIKVSIWASHTEPTHQIVEVSSDQLGELLEKQETPGNHFRSLQPVEQVPDKF